MPGFFDAPPIPREEWKPLVEKGQDREQVLDEIVVAWCTSYGKTEIDEHIAAGGLVIVGKVFEDANTEKPIDLSELLKLVEQRLREDGEPEEFRQTDTRHIIIRDCNVSLASAIGTKIRPRFTSLRVQYDRWRFERARFGDNTCFRSVTFGNYSSFESTIFGDSASFKKSRFGNLAKFDSARFGESANFAETTFGISSRFRSAKFANGVTFRLANIDADARFTSAIIGGDTDFCSARFGNGVVFDSASFGDHVDFSSAIFGIAARFHSSTFGKWAAFDKARFDGLASFGSARFASWASFDGTVFDYRPNFVNCEFGFEGGVDGVSPTQPVKSGSERVTRWLTRPLKRFSWRKVREIGELRILTRVSYWALIIVPILAGSWPAVRAGINWVNHDVRAAAEYFHDAAERLERAGTHFQNDPRTLPQESTASLTLIDAENRLDEGMAIVRRIAAQLGGRSLETPMLPMTLVFVFFAALAVTLGHLVYQVWADEGLRRQTIEDFLRERNTEFLGCTENQRRILLMQAIPPIRELAERMPADRHPNFVRRQNKTVWIPSSLDQLLRVRSREEPGSSDAETAPKPDTLERSVAPDDEPTPADSRQPKPALWREELELVVVHEGALAEYELTARKEIDFAALSAILYLVGFGLILWVIYLQSASILRQGGIIGS